MKKIESVYQSFMMDNASKGLSKPTIVYYKTALKAFFVFLNERKILRPCKITTNILTAYKAHLGQQNLSIDSINTYLRAVRRFLAYSAEQGYTEHFNVKLMKNQQRSRVTFTDEEVETIFAAADKGIAHLVSVFLLGTGVRANTLINIRVADIDFNNGFFILNTTKNKLAAALPLTDPLVELLKQHINNNGLHTKDYLFFNKKGTCFTRFTLWRTLERFLLSCGIEKTGIHIYRHTFAKMMVLNGCDAFTLQRWLTHSSIEQSRRYVNLFAQDLAATMNCYNPTMKLGQYLQSH